MKVHSLYVDQLRVSGLSFCTNPASSTGASALFADRSPRRCPEKEAPSLKESETTFRSTPEQSPSPRRFVPRLFSTFSFMLLLVGCRVSAQRSVPNLGTFSPSLRGASVSVLIRGYLCGRILSDHNRISNRASSRGMSDRVGFNRLTRFSFHSLLSILHVLKIPATIFLK